MLSLMHFSKIIHFCSNMGLATVSKLYILQDKNITKKMPFLNMFYYLN